MRKIMSLILAISIFNLNFIDVTAINLVDTISLVVRDMDNWDTSSDQEAEKIEEDTTPEVEKNSLNAEDTAQDDEDATPEVEEVTPEVEEVTPEVEEVIPEVEDVIPEVEDVIPEVEDVIPEYIELLELPTPIINGLMKVGEVISVNLGNNFNLNQDFDIQWYTVTSEVVVGALNNYYHKIDNENDVNFRISEKEIGLRLAVGVTPKKSDVYVNEEVISIYTNEVVGIDDTILMYNISISYTDNGNSILATHNAFNDSGEFMFQWYLVENDKHSIISGATSREYALNNSDVGKTFVVSVTPSTSNDIYSNIEVFSSELTIKSSLPTPVIIGYNSENPKVLDTLTIAPLAGFDNFDNLIIKWYVGDDKRAVQTGSNKGNDSNNNAHFLNVIGEYIGETITVSISVDNTFDNYSNSEMKSYSTGKVDTISFDVEYILKDLVTDNNATVNYGENYSFNLVVLNEKYLPSSINVTMNNMPYNNFSYNSETGRVVVNNVIGNIVIIAEADDIITEQDASENSPEDIPGNQDVLDGYTVTFELANSQTIHGEEVVVEKNNAFNFRLIPERGYLLPEEITINSAYGKLSNNAQNYTYDNVTGMVNVANVSSDLTIIATTGDIDVNFVEEITEVKVLLDIDNRIDCSLPKTSYHDAYSELRFKLQPQDGYTLSDFSIVYEESNKPISLTYDDATDEFVAVAQTMTNDIVISAYVTSNDDLHNITTITGETFSISASAEDMTLSLESSYSFDKYNYSNFIDSNYYYQMIYGNDPYTFVADYENYLNYDAYGTGNYQFWLEWDTYSYEVLSIPYTIADGYRCNDDCFEVYYTDSNDAVNFVVYDDKLYLYNLPTASNITIKATAEWIDPQENKFQIDTITPNSSVVLPEYVLHDDDGYWYDGLKYDYSWIFDWYGINYTDPWLLVSDYESYLQYGYSNTYPWFWNQWSMYDYEILEIPYSVDDGYRFLYGDNGIYAEVYYTDTNEAIEFVDWGDKIYILNYDAPYSNITIKLNTEWIDPYETLFQIDSITPNSSVELPTVNLTDVDGDWYDGSKYDYAWLLNAYSFYYNNNHWQLISDYESYIQYGYANNYNWFWNEWSMYDYEIFEISYAVDDGYRFLYGDNGFLDVYYTDSNEAIEYYDYGDKIYIFNYNDPYSDITIKLNTEWIDPQENKFQIDCTTSNMTLEMPEYILSDDDGYWYDSFKYDYAWLLDSYGVYYNDPHLFVQSYSYNIEYDYPMYGIYSFWEQWFFCDYEILALPYTLDDGYRWNENDIEVYYTNSKEPIEFVAYEDKLYILNYKDPYSAITIKAGAEWIDPQENKFQIDCTTSNMTLEMPEYILSDDDGYWYDGFKYDYAWLFDSYGGIYYYEPYMFVEDYVNYTKGNGNMFYPGFWHMYWNGNMYGYDYDYEILALPYTLADGYRWNDDDIEVYYTDSKEPIEFVEYEDKLYILNYDAFSSITIKAGSEWIDPQENKFQIDCTTSNMTLEMPEYVLSDDDGYWYDSFKYDYSFLMDMYYSNFGYYESYYFVEDYVYYTQYGHPLHGTMWFWMSQWPSYDYEVLALPYTLADEYRWNDDYIEIYYTDSKESIDFVAYEDKLYILNYTNPFSSITIKADAEWIDPQEDKFQINYNASNISLDLPAPYWSDSDGDWYDYYGKYDYSWLMDMYGWNYFDSFMFVEDYESYIQGGYYIYGNMMFWNEWSNYNYEILKIPYTLDDGYKLNGNVEAYYNDSSITDPIEVYYTDTDLYILNFNYCSNITINAFAVEIDQYEGMYKLELNLNNLSLDLVPDAIDENGDYWFYPLYNQSLYFNLYANTGYDLPNYVNVYYTDTDDSYFYLDYYYVADNGFVYINNPYMFNVTIVAEGVRNDEEIPPHSVSFDLYNTSSTGSFNDEIEDSTSYSFILTANTDYELPDSISIKMGTNVLTVNKDYSYDVDSGLVTIFSVTDDLVIQVSSIYTVDVSRGYTVSYALQNLVTSGSNFDTVKNGDSYTFTLSPSDDSYLLPDCIVVFMGENTLTVNNMYTYDNTTGEVVIDNIIGNLWVFAAAYCNCGDADCENNSDDNSDNNNDNNSDDNSDDDSSGDNGGDYTVILIDASGNIISTTKTQSDNTLSYLPSLSTNDDQYFIGWYFNNELITTDTVFTSDAVISPKITYIYTPSSTGYISSTDSDIAVYSNDIEGNTITVAGDTVENFVILPSSIDDTISEQTTVILPDSNGNNVTWTIPAGSVIDSSNPLNLGVTINDNNLNSNSSVGMSMGYIDFAHTGDLLSSGSGLTITFQLDSVDYGDSIIIYKLDDNDSLTSTSVTGLAIADTWVRATFTSCSKWEVFTKNYTSYPTYPDYQNHPNDYNDYNKTYDIPTFGYIAEFKNVVLNQVINLDLINLGNNQTIIGWYYDAQLTKPVINTSYVVVTKDIISSGLYPKYEIVYTTPETGYPYPDSSNNYQPNLSTNPNTSSLLGLSLF